MNQRCLSRRELLDIINKTSFAMDDTRLFLDTHPDSREALAFFARMQEKRRLAVREYTEKFGPISSYDVASSDMWKWNMGPWPWQSSFMEGRN